MVQLIKTIDEAFRTSGRLGELVVLLCIVALVMLQSESRAILRVVPRCYVTFFSIFMIAIIAAQVLVRDQYTYPQFREPFPLTRFAMFSELSDRNYLSTKTYHFVATTRSGRQVTLNPVRSFPTIDFSTMHSRIGSMASWLNSDSLEEQTSGLRALTRICEGLARRYDRLHPKDRVEAISFIQRMHSLEDHRQDSTTLLTWTLQHAPR